MKKFLFLILCTFLLIASQSFAAGLIGKTQGMRLVASGTFTAANARSSYANTVAFACANGVDWSAYAGTDTGSTLYVIVFQDATGGDTAIGYLGANGSGETGTDFIVGDTLNGNFETGDPPTGWSPIIGAVLTRAADERTGGTGSYSINVGGNGMNLWAYQSFNGNNNFGILLKVTGYIKTISGTSSKFVVMNNAYNKLYIQLTNVNSSTWLLKTSYGVASEVTARIMLYNGSYNVTDESRYDDITVSQVTDCAATGLHIMSAKNGTTRNWYYISPTFGYNDAMTYRIYRVY